MTKDTINTLLDEEADPLMNAERYERAADREACWAGHYTRSFTTASENTEAAMPKLKGTRFAASVLERHKRHEASAGRR